MASQGLGNSPECDRFASRYEVQQVLGKRSGRRTLLARDLQTQELVVIKFLSFGHDFEWDDLKLFEREAETLKAVNHPAIPRYLDYFEVNSSQTKGFALVQTYIAAQSLEQQLKAGRSFSEVEMKQLAKALLQILIYLHGRQPPVIHRDIKPSNILLSSRSGHSVGQVYLVDFGSVQTLAAREGGTITVVGTYGYMPPEQYGGRAVPASDLYSLGATLMYLTTGKHPADLPQKDLQIQFELDSNLSPSAIDWLRRMTQPSLNQRFTSAAEALKALDQPQRQRQNYKHLSIIQKPFGSKIQLTKDAKSLEIIIPGQGSGLGFIGWMLFAIPWNLLILSLTGILIMALGITPFTILALLFGWGFSIKTTLQKILFPSFGRIQIALNQQQITIVYKLFGFQYRFPPAPRQHICKLVLTKRHVLLLDEDTSNLSASRRVSSHRFVIEEPRLIIWVGTKKYELCGEKLVTDPELDWLAQELSDWLKLPLTRE